MQPKNYLKTVLMALLTVLFFNACKKDKKEDEKKDDEKKETTSKVCKMLSYHIEMPHSTTFQPWVNVFEYSGDNIVSSTRRTLPDSNISSKTEFDYNSSGQLIRHRTSHSRRDSFVYNGDQLHRIYVIDLNPYRIINSYHLEYSGGKLSRIAQIEPTTNANEGEYRLDWTGENVTKVRVTDSLGNEKSYKTYTDYDNAPNPMRDYTPGFFGNIRNDLDVFTYLSKNNYRKITYSTSPNFRLRTVILNSDNYPDTIYDYRNSSGVLNDSSFQRYSYKCQ